MAKIANKQVICDILVEAGKKDKDIVALCSDFRPSHAAVAFQKYLNLLLQAAADCLGRILVGAAEFGNDFFYDMKLLQILGRDAHNLAGLLCPGGVLP